MSNDWLDTSSVLCKMFKVVFFLALSFQICPICAALPGGDPNHVTDDFAAHLTLEHRAPRDLISFPSWGKEARLFRPVAMMTCFDFYSENQKGSFASLKNYKYQIVNRLQVYLTELFALTAETFKRNFDTEMFFCFYCGLSCLIISLDVSRFSSLL